MKPTPPNIRLERTERPTKTRPQLVVLLHGLLLRLANVGPLLIVVLDRVAHLFGIETGFH